MRRSLSGYNDCCLHMLVHEDLSSALQHARGKLCGDKSVVLVLRQETGRSQGSGQRPLMLLLTSVLCMCMGAPEPQRDGGGVGALVKYLVGK